MAVVTLVVIAPATDGVAAANRDLVEGRYGDGCGKLDR
jgi:hypothetical protein